MSYRKSDDWPRRYPIQLLGPSLNVDIPAHGPRGSLSVGGTPPGSSHRSGMKCCASWPQICVLTLSAVMGMWNTWRRLYIPFVSREKPKRQTWPALIDSEVMIFPFFVSIGPLRGITSFWRATRSVTGNAGYKRSLDLILYRVHIRRQLRDVPFFHHRIKIL